MDGLAHSTVGFIVPHRPTRRQHFINQYQLNWSDYKTQRRLYFELRERDLRYHDIGPEHGLFYTLKRAGLIASEAVRQGVGARGLRTILG